MNRPSMMKDVMSILKSGVEIIWDCIMDTTKQLYWLFKRNDVQNDNKSHVNTSSEVMGTHQSERVKSPGVFSSESTYHTGPDGHYKIDNLEEDDEDYEEWGHDQGGSFLRKSLVLRSDRDESSNDDASYDSNQNEEDEEDWRDKFAGWLP